MTGENSGYISNKDFSKMIFSPTNDLLMTFISEVYSPIETTLSSTGLWIADPSIGLDFEVFWPLGKEMCCLNSDVRSFLNWESIQIATNSQGPNEMVLMVIIFFFFSLNSTCM